MNSKELGTDVLVVKTISAGPWEVTEDGKRMTLLFTLAPAVSSAADTEKTAIVGAWKVIEMQARGRAVSEVSSQGMKYEFNRHNDDRSSDCGRHFVATLSI